MTAVPSIDLTVFLDEHLSQASPDLLRQMLKTFAEALMSADADARCGAGYQQRSPDRTNSRNGYRERRWDTRAGTMELAIPKLRTGSYFPEWLLERRRRSEKALVTAVATSYLLGVSTRRMERLVATLGITGLSKSQVSVMASELDEQVQAFRTRPLDAGPYTFLAADALTVMARMSDRKRLFVEAGHLIVDLARRYYEQNDSSALPRSIASLVQHSVPVSSKERATFTPRSPR